MECKSFMTDFEKAMRNALRKCFPKPELYTCWFHFTQAVKKHASKQSNFIALIRSNKEAQHIYYKLMCLPLLPPGEILAAFNKLKEEAKNIAERSFKNFIVYYEHQWIVVVRE